ncbi:hypothetical protein CTE07_49320 [Chitinophaga terrae (ex Kim and Jung 2007)]|nr:hypothetical protein CTE07_49320 [Chitinophaga terrae (ex Kim and Jung 2007)]
METVPGDSYQHLYNESKAQQLKTIELLWDVLKAIQPHKIHIAIQLAIKYTYSWT